MNLILVGFMGSGKTTVSTLLGEALQQPVYDLDDEVEKAACKPIPQIFADDGEASFRDLEHSALKEVVKRRQGILATGGGTPVAERNQRLLEHAQAPVILLTASPAETARRLGDGEGRPLASKLTPAELADLQDARRPAYDRCADLTIRTDKLSPTAVTKLIIAFLRIHQDQSA
ncbi:shikimate kinase [Limosilactobacillus fermentum]|uniref:shikimate kinase n=1 Tax=Limosilactobacillus fermentum TaxID=1613 RepID=UPI0008A6827F|nr:shikimate kinase [Limosilactobacillus fermentum]AOY85974.1 shikimate kinase [Limosilactobacillus fermentum]QID93476.1 shikimate kinase [Limosilactobacillus fermentum]UTF48445.1 shikimate kinase [Limosilactobacillus fermentum]